MKNIIKITTLILMVMGCAKKEKEFTYQKSLFTKAEILLSNRGESTPIIWNAELLTMVSVQTTWNSSNTGSIEIYKGTTLISKTNATFSLASAIVDNNALYVIGSRNWDLSENSFYMKSTKDLINWTDEIQVVSPKNGVILYNNSVAKVGNKYVMTYETCEPNTVCFNIRFKISDDLINWTDIGEIYGASYYVACPTIRYFNGYYYMFYAVQVPDMEPACETRITRSADLVNWNDGGVVLTPRDGYNKESICDSDFDFVEYNGKLEVLYIEGNQKTWHNLRRAYYDGTFENFINSISFQ